MAALKKDTKLKRRIEEIKSALQDIESDRMRIIEPTIEQMAQLEEYLELLNKEIAKVGFVETYQNGDNQFGKKESTESKCYNSTIKNYNMLVRTVIGVLPPAQQQQAEDELTAFLRKGK